MGVLYLVLFCYILLSELSSFTIILTRKYEQDALLWLSPWCLVTDCLCLAALSHDAVGWSAVCACGISGSYSLSDKIQSPDLELNCL